MNTTNRPEGGSPTSVAVSRHIVVVASYLQHFGGVEQMLVDLVGTADRAGWRVTVVSPRRLEPGGRLERALPGRAEVVTAEGCWQRRPGARLVRSAAVLADAVRSRAWPDRRRRAALGGERAKPYLDGFWSRPEGRRLLDGADLVHVLGSHPFGARAIAAAGAVGRPVVYGETSTPTGPSVADPYHEPFRLALSDIVAVTTQSTVVADAFRQHYGWQGPLSVIDQSLDAALEAQLLDVASASPAARGPLTVGALSRLADGKGLDTLLEGTAIALGEGHDIRLVLGGDGPIAASLQALADDLGVAARVTFPGVVEADDRAAFLGAIDVFAMLSVAEAGPYTGIEAMAAGRAVMTTPVGAMPDRLVPDRDALFCAVGDVAGVAGALGGLADDPARVRSLAVRARAAYVARNRSADLAARVQSLWAGVVGDEVSATPLPDTGVD